MLVARKASCRVANLCIFDQIEANLAEIKSKNHLNVQKKTLELRLKVPLGSTCECCCLAGEAILYQANLKEICLIRGGCNLEVEPTKSKGNTVQ